MVGTLEEIRKSDKVLKFRRKMSMEFDPRKQYEIVGVSNCRLDDDRLYVWIEEEYGYRNYAFMYMGTSREELEALCKEKLQGLLDKHGIMIDTARVCKFFNKEDNFKIISQDRALFHMLKISMLSPDVYIHAHEQDDSYVKMIDIDRAGKILYWAEAGTIEAKIQKLQNKIVRVLYKILPAFLKKK